jgi:hypothetical protein
MKFMNTKRFASTVMAGVLTLSLAVPAFAADSSSNNTSTVISGAYEEIPISVSVPTTGEAQINPYGLPVTITKTDDKTVDLVGQKITTKPLSVKNMGSTKLDMNATLAVVPKGDVVIAAAKGTDDKTIKVDLEVAAMNDTALAVSSDSETLENLLVDRFADEGNWENATKLAAPAATKGATTVAPAASNAAMAVLGAVTAKAEGFTYSKDSIALFRLTGDLNAEPKAAGADDPWKETDGFTATIVFKFAPHADIAASVSLPSTKTGTVGATGETIDATFNPGDSGLTVKSWAWTSETPATAVVTGTTASGALTYVAAGTTKISVTATLSDDSTVTAECTLTVAAAATP